MGMARNVARILGAPPHKSRARMEASCAQKGGADGGGEARRANTSSQACSPRASPLLVRLRLGGPAGSRTPHS
ncbi:hypothetical protein SAMN05216525_111112 [Bradyrhizobium sp. Gha]|nr:hypothetical protein SAMN05216525_111112 [Bradyrhizobium sp. Gha]